jgi:exosome complex RNA-binding protein Rrp42 (RNase PH superfamily)
MNLEDIVDISDGDTMNQQQQQHPITIMPYAHDDKDNNNNVEETERNNNLFVWMNLIQTMIGTADTDVHILQQQPKGGEGYYNIHYGILSNSSLPSSSISSSSPLVGSVMVRTCSSNHNSNTTNHSNNGMILITSVSIQIGQPTHPLALNQGDIIISINDIQNNNNNNNNTSLLITIQSHLQRIIEENIPLQQLCISKGKIAYRLYIVINILQNHYITTTNSNLHPYSNLLDICLLSIVHALLDTKLPIYNKIDDTIMSEQVQQQQQQQQEQEQLLQVYQTLELPILPFSVTAIGTCYQSSSSSSSSSLNNTIHWSMVDPCCIYENNNNHNNMIEDINSTKTSFVQITIVFNVVTLTTKITTTSNNNPTTTTATSSSTENENQDDDDLEILSLQIVPYMNDTNTSASTTNTNNIMMTDTQNGISINELMNLIHISQQYVIQIHSNHHIRIHSR